MFPGVALFTPVMLIFRCVLLVHPLPDVVSKNILFTAGIIRICGAIEIGFSGGRCIGNVSDGTAT